MKVRELFGLKAVKGDVGIEIEVEGTNLPKEVAGWRREHDGSLRGESAEYVFARPYAAADYPAVLARLGEAYKKNKSVIKDTKNAGIHAHINVQELEVIQVINFITLFVALEEVMVRFCGEFREGNLFCLRTKDAERMVIDLLANSKRLNRMNSDKYRYAALNIKALFQYGSLEFRSMRTTADFEVIQLWVDCLLRLRTVATEFDNPAAILTYYSEHGPDRFVDRVLGPFRRVLCDLNVDRRLVQEGIWASQMLAFGTDWEADLGKQLDNRAEDIIQRVILNTRDVKRFQERVDNYDMPRKLRQRPKDTPLHIWKAQLDRDLALWQNRLADTQERLNRLREMWDGLNNGIILDEIVDIQVREMENQQRRGNPRQARAEFNFHIGQQPF